MFIELCQMRCAQCAGWISLVVSSAGYCCSLEKRLRTGMYGCPQTRDRMIFLASLKHRAALGPRKHLKPAAPDSTARSERQRMLFSVSISRFPPPPPEFQPQRRRSRLFVR